MSEIFHNKKLNKNKTRDIGILISDPLSVALDMSTNPDFQFSKFKIGGKNILKWGLNSI